MGNNLSNLGQFSIKLIMTGMDYSPCNKIGIYKSILTIDRLKRGMQGGRKG